MASQLVDSLHRRFRPGAFKDSYRERVLDLIKRKAKGEELDLPEPEAAEETPDLMAALEASLGGKSGRGRRSGGRGRGTAGRGQRSSGQGRRQRGGGRKRQSKQKARR